MHLYPYFQYNVYTITIWHLHFAYNVLQSCVTHVTYLYIHIYRNVWNKSIELNWNKKWQVLHFCVMYDHHQSYQSCYYLLFLFRGNSDLTSITIGNEECIICHIMTCFEVYFHTHIASGDYPCEDYFFVETAYVSTTFMFHDSLWHHNG